MKKPTAGKYKHRVRIEKRDEQAVSGMNEIVESWDLYCLRWAEIVPTTGREFSGGDKVASDVTHRVAVRYDTTTAAITSKLRLKMGDREFNIVHATDDGMNQEVLMLVREVTT